MQVITDWFRRHFSDPQVVFLAAALIVGFAVVLSMGYMLAPALASIVIAYLLEGLVAFLQRHGWPRLVAVLVVYIAFMVFLIMVLFGVIPVVSRQVTELVQQLPSMISDGLMSLTQLPERYPEVVTAEQVQQLLIAASESGDEVLYQVELSTGLREGELSGLKWSDINWGRATIRIQRQVANRPLTLRA